MSVQNRVTRKKIHYPFIVQPSSEGWEVLFTATDRPHREALFGTRQAALDFAEINNDRWRQSRESMYELIARLKASAEVSCPPRTNQSQSIIRRVFGSLRERLLNRH